MTLDKQALDRYITGNYGEDQFKGIPDDGPAEADADEDRDFDDHTCAGCKRHIGWDIDADDDGRAVGVFTAYWGYDDGDLVCEDCMMVREGDE
jgi:hypothetical protein